VAGRGGTPLLEHGDDRDEDLRPARPAPKMHRIEQYAILPSFLMASYGQAERGLRTLISERTSPTSSPGPQARRGVDDGVVGRPVPLRQAPAAHDTSVVHCRLLSRRRWTLNGRRCGRRSADMRDERAAAEPAAPSSPVGSGHGPLSDVEPARLGAGSIGPPGDGPLPQARHPGRLQGNPPTRNPPHQARP
jgi:hypothetical protein